VFDQIKSVNNVLEEIGCKDKEMLILLNKCDAIKSISDLETLQTLYPNSVTISAKTGTNLEEVASVIAEKINGSQKDIKVTCDMANGKLQSYLRKHAEITDEQYDNNQVQISAKIGANKIETLRNLNPARLEVNSQTSKR
jgi:GTPase